MYSETKNYARYFENKIKDTDGVHFANMSVKTGEYKGEKTYSSWLTKFVGDAKDAILEADIEPGETLILTKWKVTNEYSKETEKTYPTLIVFDFEIAPPFEEEKPKSKRR
jgi:hypothetical protein